MLVERLKREGELLQSVSHPNIIRCYEFGEESGRFFLVMDYIDGTNLELMIKNENKFDLDTAFSILIPIIDAMSYLHNRGIVRVDLKPKNILISRSGSVYLIDLGIARSESIEDASLTATGAIIGTPIYIAPEQAMGKRVDGRVDIYSMGIILYEVLTGKLPFEGDTPAAFIMAHIHGTPVPPREYNPDIPVALEAIILKCLEKDPDARFQSFQELQSELPAFETSNLAPEVMQSIEAKQEVDRWEEFDTQPFRPISQVIEGVAPREETTTGEIPQYEPVEPHIPPPSFIEKDAVSEVLDASVPITWVPEPENQPYLAISRGQWEGKWYGLDEKTRLRIGRSIDNDVVLATTKASRYHAEVLYGEGNYVVRDLNTSNGTIVNDLRITEKELVDGDAIRIGDVILVFRDPRSAEEIN
jgi:serine/threonine protein kinase